MDRTQGTAWSDFERYVRWTIEAERPEADTFLPEGERESFAFYYENLPRPGDERAIQRFLRGMWRGEAGWVARWLHARSGGIPHENGVAVVRAERPRVMDAGAGFGTYAMMFAAMGGDVVGADLRPDRLDAAQRRLEFYRESTGRALEVRYQRIDLTDPWPLDCDLVWVHNALSHIDPLESFMARVQAHLRPGGLFVVGDINGAQPAHLKRLAELRTEVHQEYVAPDGERHGYAVERPFPPGELRGLVTEKGLKIVRHELYWGGLGVLPDLVYGGLLEPLQARWWLGRRFARRQLMVAAM